MIRQEFWNGGLITLSMKTVESFLTAADKNDRYVWRSRVLPLFFHKAAFHFITSLDSLDCWSLILKSLYFRIYRGSFRGWNDTFLLCVSDLLSESKKIMVNFSFYSIFMEVNKFEMHIPNSFCILDKHVGLMSWPI